MAPGPEILHLLASILAASHNMLASAREENWDALVDQELGRRDAIAKLQEYVERPGYGLPLELQAKANTLIQEIGRLDEETMALTERRKAEIGQLFHSAEVSKRLSKAYRSL